MMNMVTPGYIGKRMRKKGKDNRYVTECLGKIKHKSLLAAQTTFDMMKAERSNKDNHLDIYKCSFCDFYHIGSARNNDKNK